MLCAYDVTCITVGIETRVISRRYKVPALLSSHWGPRMNWKRESLGNNEVLVAVRMAITSKSANNTRWREHGEKEPSYTAGGNVNWCSHCGESY